MALIFGQGIIGLTQQLQDTHVPRDGRDLIRKTLEDANVIFSVSSLIPFTPAQNPSHRGFHSCTRSKPSTLSSGILLPRADGMPR